MATKKLSLRNLTPDQRDEIDQHVADLSVQCKGSPTEIAKGLSHILGMTVTRSQIQGMMNHKGVIARRRKDAIAQGATPERLVNWYLDVMTNDIADFAEMYPHAIGEQLKEMKRRGLPTHLIKSIKLGGRENDEIKEIIFHDAHDAAAKLSQVLGMLKEQQGGTSIGNLNMLVATDGDIYENAKKQLTAMKKDPKKIDAKIKN